MQKHIKIFLKSRGFDWTESHYNCEKCYWNNWVDVHHIISRRYDNTDRPDNLIMLCRSCHQYIHNHNTTKNKAELFALVDKYKETSN